MPFTFSVSCLILLDDLAPVRTLLLLCTFVNYHFLHLLVPRGVHPPTWLSSLLYFCKSTDLSFMFTLGVAVSFPFVGGSVSFAFDYPLTSPLAFLLFHQRRIPTREHILHIPFVRASSPLCRILQKSLSHRLIEGSILPSSHCCFGV